MLIVGLYQHIYVQAGTAVGLLQRYSDISRSIIAVLRYCSSRSASVGPPERVYNSRFIEVDVL